MAAKKTESKKEKEEALFTKEQILASNKYAEYKDICNVVIPEGFHGTLKEADVLIDKFLKGKVK